jgi:hypothetical protein
MLAVKSDRSTRPLQAGEDLPGLIHGAAGVAALGEEPVGDAAGDLAGGVVGVDIHEHDDRHLLIRGRSRCAR